MAKRRLLACLIFVFIGSSVFSQNFPPPTYFLANVDDDQIILSWNPPDSKSLVQYNIYYYGFINGLPIHIGSTTETNYTIPFPTFANSMSIGLTAEYIDPAGASDTLWAFMVCPWFWGFPMEIDFEDSEVYCCGMVANIMKGYNNWELTDTTYNSEGHSAGFISDSLNFKSALTTTLIESYETETPSLSFMYKIPEKQGITDTLKLFYYSFTNYYLLTNIINPTNEWQEYQCSLETLPNSFHFAFEATSGGGGGVFIDDILFYDKTVDVPIHEFDKSQLMMNLNQFSSSLEISFSSKENAIF